MQALRRPWSGGTEDTMPGLMDVITQGILDKDGDGSVVNELGGMVGKLFGGR